MAKINGTLINYFFHCPRQCHLHANRINLEDNSEDVRIGKILHEINEEKTKGEISIDNVKLDNLTKEYITEFKKSDSDIEASKMQLMLYMYKLKQLGIERKGQLIFDEKNKQNKKSIKVELDEDYLLKTLKNIETLIQSDEVPKADFKPKCKKCAYYEYCFI